MQHNLLRKLQALFFFFFNLSVLALFPFLHGDQMEQGLFFLLQSSNTQFVPQLPINNPSQGLNEPSQEAHISESVCERPLGVPLSSTIKKNLPKKLHVGAASRVISLAAAGGGR